jgi:hypothetical protein
MKQPAFDKDLGQVFPAWLFVSVLSADRALTNRFASRCRTLFIGGGRRLLYGRLALTGLRQASNQDQSDCIHLLD